jgi:hypothetical protein
VNDVLRTNSDNEGYFDSGSRTPLEWPVNADSRLLLDTMYRAIVCILPCICQAVGDLSNPLTDSRNSGYRRSVGVTVGITAQSRFGFGSVSGQVSGSGSGFRVRVRVDVLNEEVERCRVQFRPRTVGVAAQSLSALQVRFGRVEVRVEAEV